MSETTVMLAPLNDAITVSLIAGVIGQHATVPVSQRTLRSLPPAIRSSLKRSFEIWSVADFSSATVATIGSAATWTPSQFPRPSNRRSPPASTG